MGQPKCGEPKWAGGKNETGKKDEQKQKTYSIRGSHVLSARAKIRTCDSSFVSNPMAHRGLLFINQAVLTKLNANCFIANAGRLPDGSCGMQSVMSGDQPLQA